MKRARGGALILVLTALSMLLAARPAHGFSIMETAAGKKLHWIAAEMPVPFHIESGPTEVGDGSDIDAMIDSFLEWERPQCSYLTFELVDDARSTGGNACGGPRNTLAWVEQGWPPELGRAVVAITMTCFEPGGGILGARILFNGQDHEWATDGRSTAIDVQNVTTHEIGHFVGIGHSDVPGTTMWPTTSTGDVSQRELHRDDVEAVCYLYPNPQPWAPGADSGVMGGARDTAERLGVDRVGGCHGDAGEGGAKVGLALLLGGLLAAGWGSFGGRRRAKGSRRNHFR